MQINVFVDKLLFDIVVWYVRKAVYKGQPSE